MKSMMIVTKSLLFFAKTVVMVTIQRNTECEQVVPTQLRRHWTKVKFSAFVKTSCEVSKLVAEPDFESGCWGFETLPRSHICKQRKGLEYDKNHEGNVDTKQQAKD